ncbi:MAG: DUF1588 domain-containing protein [Planctomycetota bacterium]|nr:DUF1588 domain-containing protein [Planctomycetota bacterium]
MQDLNSFRALGVVVALTIALSGLHVDAAEPPTDESRTKAFLTKHCLSCHGPDTQEKSVAFHKLDFARLAGKDAHLWIKVVEQLKFGQMPPPDAPQPARLDAERVASWIQSRLVEAGHELDVDHKLGQPSYANLLNHEKLFDGSITGPAFSPPRLWRLHPEAYSLFLETFGRQLAEGGPLSKPFTVGDGKGVASNYAALSLADSATLGQLMLNCRQIATWQTVGFRRLKKDNRTKEMVERIFINSPQSFAEIIANQDAPTDTQIAAAVSEEFELVLSRPPSEDEASAYGDLLRRSIEIGGKANGLHTLAMAVLLRPDAIYRMEVGLGKTDEHGRRMLSPYELAHAIAYALTDTPPDQLLLGPRKPNDRSQRPQPPSLMDLAERGELKTRADVQRVVNQIWENDHIEQPRILRFFQEFFGYHAAETVFKGDRANRAFVTKFLVSDADQFVLHHVARDRDVLKELLTTDRYFVQWPGSRQEYDRRIDSITKRNNNSQRKDVNFKYFVERTAKGLHPIPQANPTWRQTVRFYNLDERTWDFPLEQPFAMPPKERVGILTHPAWLVAWSGNFENDPIRRGKWIREHLLAGSIPEIPITVNAQVPEDPHKTLRDRLQVTRKEYCWQCHQKMEPLGLPFEAFTDFGRFRTKEGLGHTHALGNPKETAPVITSGQIIKSGDASIDGDVADVRDLMHRLANSPRVRQSFVRHAFRYWMGRNEKLGDSPTLIAADKAYVDNGGSFKSMVIELLTSDSFLCRK